MDTVIRSTDSHPCEMTSSTRCSGETSPCDCNDVLGRTEQLSEVIHVFGWFHFGGVEYRASWNEEGPNTLGGRCESADIIRILSDIGPGSPSPLSLTLFRAIMYGFKSLQALVFGHQQEDPLCRSLRAVDVPVSTADCRACADPCDLGNDPPQMVI